MNKLSTFFRETVTARIFILFGIITVIFGVLMLMTNKKNQKVIIYYNPQNPSQITQTNSLIIPIVFIVAGIASLIGGIVSGLNEIKRIKKLKGQERN